MSTVAIVFGIMANVFCIFFYLSPIPLMHQYRKNPKVDIVPYFLFITNTVQASWWVMYAVHLENPVIFVANILNVAFNSTYLILYLYIRFRAKGLKYIILFVGLETGMLIGLYFTPNDIVGWGATIINSFMQVSPFQKFHIAIRDKDYRFIPIFPAIANFFNSGSWLGYGIATNDINVIIPNAIGFGGCIILIVTFAILKTINPNAGKEVLLVKVQETGNPNETDINENLLKSGVNQNMSDSNTSITLQ